MPNVRRLYLYILSLAWNTVKYLEESASSVYQKADLKSTFKNSLQLASLDLISSCCGIGLLVGIMALLTLCAFKVILSDPSALGVITIFETDSAGWFIGCSSVISWFIMSCITFDT